MLPQTLLKLRSLNRYLCKAFRTKRNKKELGDLRIRKKLKSTFCRPEDNAIHKALKGRRFKWILNSKY